MKRTWQGKVLGFLKFMITQQRLPISAVSMTINGQWQQLVRSGDGYWQPTSYNSNDPQVLCVQCARGGCFWKQPLRHRMPVSHPVSERDKNVTTAHPYAWVWACPLPRVSRARLVTDRDKAQSSARYMS